MKNRLIITLLAVLFSFTAISVSYAGVAKFDKNLSCKKQAKKIKFKNMKEKNAFYKSCEKSKARKKAK